MDIRVFDLAEAYRTALEELLFQLSGKKRTIRLENHPNTYNIGAFDEEQLVGFAQLFILPKTTFTMGHLEDVIVHEAYRSQGIGRKLMEEVLVAAKREGCSVLSLTTRTERTEAQALFESFGFKDPGNMVLRLSLD